MEKIIVAAIVIGAVYYLVRLFRKQSSGKGGCACGSKCGSCPLLEKDHENTQKKIDDGSEET